MKLKKFTALLLSFITLALPCMLGACRDDGGKEEPAIEIPYDPFYDASKWEYMTSGNVNAPGEVPVSLADGSIRFFRTSQAYELGETKNGTISFLLKGTHDWDIRLNASSKSSSGDSYCLKAVGGELRLEISTDPNVAAALVVSDYEHGEWNRFDVTFTTDGNLTNIDLTVNGFAATLVAGAKVAGVTVEGDTLIHERADGFQTGGYFCVKVWEANNYVQMKPVELEKVADVPVLAVVGDSITEGSGATNFYLDNYPAQLQSRLGGSYNVINFGLSGRTVRTDLPPENGAPSAWLHNPQWEGVQAIVPDIAIVKLGTNDSKTSNVPATTHENFKQALNSLIDELLSVNPDMEIFLCTSAYVYKMQWNISNENVANIIVPVQKEIAAERHFPLIDFYTITQNKSSLFPDGVHPSSKGYTMFAEVLQKVILEGTDSLTEDFLSDIDARYND